MLRTRLCACGQITLGNGTSWVWQNTVRYVYDGRSVIQERDGDNWPQVAYTRGNDLSGTLEGAGGIGGLLARSHGFTNCNSTLTINITNVSGFCIYDLAIWDDYGTYVTGASIDNESVGSYSFTGVPGRTYYVFGWSCDPYYIQVFYDGFVGTLENHNVHFVGEGDWNCDPGANCVTESGNPLCQSGFSGGQWLTHNYYHADDNGNITAMESSAQTLTASYLYDPFGNLISQSGGLATANSYRFSSKEVHAASGLYYYGFRFYSPNLQRWVNRDPLEENGGINLFAILGNNALTQIDPLGWSDFNAPPSSVTGPINYHHPVSWQNQTFAFWEHPLVKGAGWTQENLRLNQLTVPVYGHSGRDTDYYHNQIDKRLDAAHDAIGSSTDRAKCDVAFRGVVADAIDDIKSGDLKINPNRTITPVEDRPPVPYRDVPRPRGGPGLGPVLNVLGTFLFFKTFYDMLFHPERIDSTYGGGEIPMAALDHDRATSGLALIAPGTSA